MRGKKALLGGAWGGSGLAAATLKMGRCGSRSLVILAYHRVIDMPDEDAFAGDPELVSASVADFQRQMCFVCDHFTPLSLADVLKALDDGAPLPRRSLVVTFDDGHADNYTHAFPVLRSLGVPATIFLSTAYIDSPYERFWFDRVAELFYYAPPGRIELTQLDHQALLGDLASRRHETGQLLRRLKREPNARRLAVLGELEATLAACVPAERKQERAAMTWEEVREMGDAGIEFGSHTVTHPILSQLDDAAIDSELTVSRERIHACTGQAAVAVAYPVGKIGAYDQRVLRSAKNCGYRIGLSYESGINRSLGPDLFELRRLAVERYVSFGHFKATLSLPGVFAE